MLIELGIYGVGVLSGYAIRYFSHSPKANKFTPESYSIPFASGVKTCSICTLPLGLQAVRTHDGQWLCSEHKVTS